jgi:hypothetical protein
MNPVLKVGRAKKIQNPANRDRLKGYTVKINRPDRKPVTDGSEPASLYFKV